MGGVYYNEFDENAAAILRQLMADGLIPHGDVDTRSIQDIIPYEIAGYAQCHFFAGIGGWPLALRLAGVADDERLWTASCPCQPFSAAGEGGGFDDERHLWPDLVHLVRVCCPGLILGEQVASAPAMQWIDLVRADLEIAGYACGAVDLPAAGAGAPHIRQRLIWVGHTHEWRLQARHDGPGARRQRAAAIGAYYAGRDAEFLADATGERPPAGVGLERRDDIALELERQGDYAGLVALAERRRLAGRDQERRWAGAALPPGALAGQLADGHGNRLDAHAGAWVHHAEHHAESRGIVLGRVADSSSARSPACELEELRGTWRIDEGGAVEQRRGAQWAAARWLACSDGKARAVEPGIFPLATRLSGRVGVLRGAGNAISPPIVAEAIEAFFESLT